MKTNTWKEAAYAAYERLGSPASLREVFKYIRKNKLIDYAGDERNAVSTLRGQISRTIKVFGEASPFIRCGRGTYYIRSGLNAIGRSSFEERYKMTVAQKYSQPESVSLSKTAAETGISQPTLTTWITAIRRKGQAIIAGPPGTGKTHCARWLAAHLVSDGDGFIDIVQFHSAYTYEDFIEGIRPKVKDGRLDYPVEQGRLLRFLAEAERRTGTSVLIVDEINRANLAQVFGELLYLLEYRQGVAGPKTVPVTLKLANGGEIAIPQRVLLLGTMNTADRSVALVDHAMRRRFAILPLRPEYSILVDRCTAVGRGDLGETLRQILEEINRAIDDPHYNLGISYFLGIASAESPLEFLASIWVMEIEPYLEEFFAERMETARRFAWARIASRFTA